MDGNPTSHTDVSDAECHETSSSAAHEAESAPLNYISCNSHAEGTEPTGDQSEANCSVAHHSADNGQKQDALCNVSSGHEHVRCEFASCVQSPPTCIPAPAEDSTNNQSNSVSSSNKESCNTTAAGHVEKPALLHTLAHTTRVPYSLSVAAIDNLRSRRISFAGHPVFDHCNKAGNGSSTRDDSENDASALTSELSVNTRTSRRKSHVSSTSSAKTSSTASNTLHSTPLGGVRTANHNTLAPVEQKNTLGKTVTQKEGMGSGILAPLRSPLALAASHHGTTAIAVVKQKPLAVVVAQKVSKHTPVRRVSQSSPTTTSSTTGNTNENNSSAPFTSPKSYRLTRQLQMAGQPRTDHRTNVKGDNYNRDYELTHVCPLHQAPQEVSVRRDSHVSRPPAWNSQMDIDKQRHVTERLPSIKMRQKGKFDYLSEGRSVSDNRRDRERRHASIVAIMHATRRDGKSCFAGLVQKSSDGAITMPLGVVESIDTDSSTRRSLCEAIRISLSELDFVRSHRALQQHATDKGSSSSIASSRRRSSVDGDNSHNECLRATKSLFAVLSQDKPALTREDVHNLLALFTDPGVAPHEVDCFFSEECEGKDTLTLRDFLCYGGRLRERLLDYAKFAAMDRETKLRTTYARIFAKESRSPAAAAASRAAAPKLHCMLARMIDAARMQALNKLPPNIRPLRAYEVFFLSSQYAPETTTGTDREQQPDEHVTNEGGEKTCTKAPGESDAVQAVINGDAKKDQLDDVKENDVSNASAMSDEMEECRIASCQGTGAPGVDASHADNGRRANNSVNQAMELGSHSCTLPHLRSHPPGELSTCGAHTNVEDELPGSDDTGISPT